MNRVLQHVGFFSTTGESGPGFLTSTAKHPASSQVKTRSSALDRAIAQLSLERSLR